MAAAQPVSTTWLGSSSARYALIHEIATGGMASVFAARLSGPGGFGRVVAVKRPHAHLAKDPDFVAMFLDEARLAAHVHHPNVVATLDVLASSEGVALVMEYVRGVPLTHLLRLGALPPDVAVAVGSAMLRGLDAAHGATDSEGRPLGLIHRDVSPQNILVDVDGQVRVADFGIAKATLLAHHTGPGGLKGKLAYMAPEQLRHETVDRRADIYAAALVLFELFTGERRRPDVDGEALHGAAGETALPTALEAVVARGLAPTVDARFDSAGAMADALERALPPAAPSAVARCVRDRAGGVIAERAQAIEIASRALARGAQTARGAPPASEAPTLLTVEAAAPPTRPGGRRVAIAIAAMALLAGGAAALVVPQQPERVQGQVLDTRVAVPSPPPTPPGASTPAPSPSTAAPPAVSHARPRGAPPGRLPSCTPPYVVDPTTGVKRYKRECL